MRSKSKRPMKRLLAKLPRSSSGSRELSARSRAAALPADIFDVSITEAAGGFALVSSEICFSGASRGCFHIRILVGRGSAEPRETPAVRRGLALNIECSSILGVLTKQIARCKLLASQRPELLHLAHKLFQTMVLRKSQRSATENRKSRPQDHAVIRVFRRRDHLLFQTARRFVHHQERQTVCQLAPGGCNTTAPTL